MDNSPKFKERLIELTKKASSEDPKDLTNEAIALAQDAINALENAEREIKILVGC